MAGSVLGAALQLQQGALWHGAVYAGLLGVGVAGWFALCAMRWGLPAGMKLSVALWGAAMAGGALAGWRAEAYAAGALPGAVEGRDLWVGGRVAGMPQHGAGVTRFTFEVASARWVAESMDGEEPPRVPARISLAWYAQGGGLWGRSETDAAPPAALAASVRAGERWRLAVRLRAPHGSLNPHG